MSFAAVMVHVDLAEPRDERVRLAAGLSSRFHSTLIGVAAWEPRPPLIYGGVVGDTEPTESLLQGMSDRLAEAAEHFRMVVGPDQPAEMASGHRFADRIPGEGSSGSRPRHCRTQSGSRRSSYGRSRRDHIEGGPTGARGPN
jgi:hypothetical protein